MANYYDVLRMLHAVTEAASRVWRCADKGWANYPPKQGQRRESDAWTTAEGVLWLLEYDRQHYAAEIADGASRLLALRHIAGNGTATTDRGWGGLLEGDSDANGTALALLALVRHAREVQRPRLGNIPQDYLTAISEGREWLRAALITHSGWGSDAERPSAFGMCWGCLALQECQELAFDPRVSNALYQTALPRVASTQIGGGWGEFFDKRSADPIGTAFCTYLLLSGENASNAQLDDCAQAGIQWLLNHRTYNGTWTVETGQSPIEAAAWGAMAFLAAGEIAETNGESEKARAYLEGAEAAITYLGTMYIPALGWPAYPGPRAEARFYTTYYAALALMRYRDAWQRARGLPPSLAGNRVFIISQTAGAQPRGAQPRQRMHDVRQLVEQSGLKPVPVEAGTFDRLMGQVESEAKQHGIDYAIVLMEDVTGTSTDGLKVAAQLTKKIDPLFITILYIGPYNLPPELSKVRLVNGRQPDWKDQITDNLLTAKLIAPSATETT